AQHKASIECDLVARLEAAIPGISSHIIYRQSASALTSWRFTWNHHGAMLGWEMSPKQLGPARPSTEGPVANLYMTGHWKRPGGGITPVIASAMHLASALTGHTPKGDHCFHSSCDKMRVRFALKKVEGRTATWQTRIRFVKRSVRA